MLQQVNGTHFEGEFVMKERGHKHHEMKILIAPTTFTENFSLETLVFVVDVFFFFQFDGILSWLLIVTHSCLCTVQAKLDLAIKFRLK